MGRILSACLLTILIIEAALLTLSDADSGNDNLIIEPFNIENSDFADNDQKQSQKMKDDDKTSYRNILFNAATLLDKGQKHENLNEKYFDHLDFLNTFDDVKNLLSIEELVISSNMSQCENDTLHVLSAFKSKQAWAASYIDAIGKPHSGFMYGAFNWPGAYQQCLSTQSLPSNASSRTFGGQYCNMNIHLPASGKTVINPTGVGATIQIGICIPDSCSKQQFQSIILKGVDVINSFLKAENVSISADSDCHPKYGSVPLTNGAIIMIFILVLFAVVIITGTFLDLWYNTDWFEFSSEPVYEKNSYSNPRAYLVDNIEEQEPVDGDHSVNQNTDTLPNNENDNSNGYLHQTNGNVPNLKSKFTDNSQQTMNTFVRIVICFSIYKNFNKLFHVEEPTTNSQTLHCVHGIRFLSLAWVILGHTYAFTFSFPANNNILGLVNYVLNNWTFDVILNGTLSVDSFFVLSGLLTAYLFYKALDKNDGAFSNAKFWAMFYFHRYWRLTPPYMLFLGVYYTLMYYLWQGPLWPSEETRFDPSCAKNYWTNLLYVNNIVNSKQMCMGWSWYLANDMQFYMISPLLMVPLYYSLAGGSVIHVVFLLASMISVGIISVNDNLGASVTSMTGEGFDAIYVKPWTRMGPYIIGLMLGYILYRMKTKRRMHWSLVLVGWLLSFGLSFTVIYSTYNVIRMKTILNVQTAALYNATNRIGWAISLSWVIFACCNGYGGIINRILSWKVFVPLSRLTYCAYLVHPALMFFFISSRETPFFLNNSVSVLLYLGFITASYALAFIVSMVFEAPMLELEKLFLRK